MSHWTALQLKQLALNGENTTLSFAFRRGWGTASPPTQPVSESFTVNGETTHLYRYWRRMEEVSTYLTSRLPRLSRVYAVLPCSLWIIWWASENVQIPTTNHVLTYLKNSSWVRVTCTVTQVFNSACVCLSKTSRKNTGCDPVEDVNPQKRWR